MAKQPTLGPDGRKSLSDKADEIHAGLIQLFAMLLVTYGENGDAFDLLSTNHRHNYLWGLADKCEQLAKAVEILSSSLAMLEVSHD